MKSYLKEIFYLLDTKAKKKIPLLVLFFLICSMLDTLGVGLVGIFVALLTDLGRYKKIFSAYTGLELPDNVMVVGGILIILTLAIRMIASLFIQNKIYYFSESLLTRLRIRLMSAYQTASYNYHLKNNSSHLLNSIQNNLEFFIKHTVTAALNLVSCIFMALCIVSFLLVLSPVSTCCLLAIFLMITLITDIFIKKRLRKESKTLSTIGGEIIKATRSGLQGLIEIRVLGNEKYFLNVLKTFSDKFAAAQSRMLALNQMPRYLIENGIAMFIVGFSLVAVLTNFDKGKLFAILGMLAIAGARLLPCVNLIVLCMNQIRSSFYHMDSVYNDLRLLEEDQVNGLNKSGADDSPSANSFASISLQNITYNYSDDSIAALRDVSLTIYRGQTVGIIGRSGAGKSTLVNIILGIIPPDNGVLTMNGYPMSNTRSWLNHFAYIPQSIFLMDDSLKKNVALGVPEDEIDDARISTAIEMAQLTDVVASLPQGVDTLIGEDGIRLSGGQRQRIALARAFYHNREIIIMDEATSALDNETESEIINMIRQLHGQKTIIIIAHRMTTVSYCDTVFRLQKGRLISSGSYEEVVGQRKKVEV